MHSKVSSDSVAPLSKKPSSYILRWPVERIDLTRYRNASYNPRIELRPGDPEFERLKKSVTEHGMAQPLVVNTRTNSIVAGNQRANVLRAMGVTEVDAVILNVSEEQERLLCIRLNVNDGKWNDQRLAEELDALLKVPDLDPELIGWSLPDIQTRIAQGLYTDLQEKEETFDIEHELTSDAPAVTQLGERVVLGRHVVVCGDSSKPETFQKLLDGKKVDCLFSDPPYNVAYYGGNRPQPSKARPKRSRQWQRIYGDNLSQAEYVEWLRGVLSTATAQLVPGAAFYIWNGHRQFGPMHAILEAMELHVSCVIVWAKETFAIGYGDYNQQTEFCLYGWTPVQDREGGHAWYGPTNESTLWEVKRDPTKSYVHPTQKPLELAERAIRNSTRPGETVLDCFLGSGTTLIGCERTGRCARGIELDPKYVDCIVRRYISFVGEGSVPADLAARYRIIDAQGVST